MKEPGDERYEFESDWSLILPNNKRHVAGRPKQSKFERDRFFRRMVLSLRGIPFPEKSGVLRIQSRVRRIGTKKWTD
jgi:hypothetical protein